MGKNATLNMAAQSQEAPPSEWKSQSLIGKISVSLQLLLEVPVAIETVSSEQCCQLSDFVARFSDFSDPPSDFFPKKRLATNLATSWTNLSESLWLRVSRWYYRTRARSCFHSAHTPPSLPLSLSLSLSLSLCSVHRAAERSSTFS